MAPNESYIQPVAVRRTNTGASLLNLICRPTKMRVKEGTNFKHVIFGWRWISQILSRQGTSTKKLIRDILCVQSKAAKIGKVHDRSVEALKL